MKKLLAALVVCTSLQSQAQTLFHYGKDSVTVNEFLRAYKKNNAGPKTEASFREYLDLYVNSRLKIAEARSMGLDTLPQMMNDMEMLRQQLLPAYLLDRAAVQKLAEEAFRRSQKDLRLAHIFISTEKTDLEGARKKADAALAMLEKSGPAAFAEVAKKYSDDPSVAQNGGEIGWITAFSLPYELENLAYHTPVGKVSKVHQSKAGLHIFRIMGERKALGKMKAAQILFAFPPGATEDQKKDLKNKAETVYQRLMKGEDFAKLAREYSNDVISSANNGQLPEFGVGEYEPVFESAVFGLASNGAITKPFLTAHGYHIVKRLGRTMVPATSTPEVMDRYYSLVEMNDRMQTVKAESLKSVMNQLFVSEPGYSLKDIQLYSDSILNYASPGQPLRINGRTSLLSIGGRSNGISRNVTGADWIGYAQVYRFRADGSGLKSYDDLWKEFVQAQVMDFYEKNLEYFNEDFKQQLSEFRDGNLFFEVMQHKIWGPAQTDSTALRSFYEKNRSRYNWKPSADAVIFYATDLEAARDFRAQLVKSPVDWQELVTDNSEKISADSARFELDQLPQAQKIAWRSGQVTAPVVNKKDNSASFAYVVKLYEQPAQRNYQEAKGLVITDYQNELEKQWVETLKQKYPVRINSEQLEELVKAKRWNQ